MANEQLQPLLPGTRVLLPDGSEALAYFDRRDGTYITAQRSGGVERRDYGWRRDYLEVIA